VAFVSAANAYRARRRLRAGRVGGLPGERARTKNSLPGPETVAAFIFEPIVGAAGGVVPAPAGYTAAIQAVCRKYDVLLIADEVMCGAGRSGTWRATEYDGVVPDIMSIAKGLAGGYIPLGATLVAAGGVGPHSGGAWRLPHGTTFSGHTAACAAGLAVQRIIERDRLLERVRNTGGRSRNHCARPWPASRRWAMSAVGATSSASNWFATAPPGRLSPRTAA